MLQVAFIHLLFSGFVRKIHVEDLGKQVLPETGQEQQLRSGQLIESGQHE